MLTRSWLPRKRLLVIAIAIAIIIVFTTLSDLQYRSSELVAGLHLPSYGGSNTAVQETAGTTTLLDPQAPKYNYVKAILDPKDNEFERLLCPAPNTKRYDYLRVDHGGAEAASGEIKYFFALNLRQAIGVIPRLLGSVLETVRFLGPENCALSIVEGHSDDGTAEVLQAMRVDMENLGLEFHLQTSDIDPKQGDRIEGLAALRNLALEPLLSNSTRYSPDTAVVFVNDVAICMEDMLELVHQRVFQNADMTCAMDWSDIDPAPIFYDIWIARAINGDTFWEIPPDGGWRFSSNLFWNHPTSRQRFDEHKAFQVFACWNGAVVFSAKPLIEKSIRFRKSKAGECYSGEPRLFCKDLWMAGYSKIAVVPSVNLDYSDGSAKKAKELHGYVSDAVKGEGNDKSLKIVWDEKPPEQVKCWHLPAPPRSNSFQPCWVCAHCLSIVDTTSSSVLNDPNPLNLSTMAAPAALPLLDRLVNLEDALDEDDDVLSQLRHPRERDEFFNYLEAHTADIKTLICAHLGFYSQKQPAVEVPAKSMFAFLSLSSSGRIGSPGT
ncbi:hypothetical protein V492_05391 [Pseudogymnoascus sp. VKM F-4246]|nr:hypothetical protein V492_05391 [Pseudogymnoascus sp. VKM F-4246]